MNLHIVKLKCTILSLNQNGEEVAKPTSTSLAIYNAGTFGNAEIETAKYFEKKASPENAYGISGINTMNIHSVLYAITPVVAEEKEIDPLWFKIKVELQGETKPFSNTYLVMAETMQKAQEFVKNSWSQSTLDVVFKTSAVINLIDYIELEGPAKEESKAKEGELDFDNSDDESPTDDHKKVQEVKNLIAEDDF